METRTGYEFHFGDPGLFVELYLPKKAQYQGALYDALTSGLNLSLVKNHLREKRTAVQEFLRPIRRLANYTDEQIEALAPVFQGYSMYEVDGVFRGGSTESPTPVEERTQVIRLMFLAPLTDDVRRDAGRFAARQFLRHWTHDLGRFEKEVAESVEGAEFGSSVRASLVKWLDDIGLFVNGYVVFMICDRILHLFEEGAIAKVEDEVWITSLRCLAVNRVLVHSRASELP